ncbi:hypothetical protein KQX54_005065 [Cotesia glomerata]|uniref:Uncharacterized protein n=1 Tax=Cotesia glomerata TaxID=32391 RepID=A0AAV7IWT5_COTGL|nr:hypothetical protein KQX54_005065 [Cotesia glomerata]
METPESRFLMKVKKEYASLRRNSKSIANPNMSINYRAYVNHTVLQMAVYFGHEEFVSDLLRMGANVNIVTCHWGTALHVAVAERRKSITKKLIKAGANVNKIGSKNYCTPIYNALMTSTFQHSIIEALLHNGVDLKGGGVSHPQNGGNFSRK